jgi:hypothetical protein
VKCSISINDVPKYITIMLSGLSRLSISKISKTSKELKSNELPQLGMVRFGLVWFFEVFLRTENQTNGPVLKIW